MRRKTLHWLDSFSKNLGLSPLRMLLSLLLLCGLGFLIYWAGFRPTPEVEVSSEAISLPATDAEQILTNMLETPVPSGTFFQVTHKINELEKELVEIENSYQLEDAQKVMVTRIRLKNKSFVVSQMLMNDIACDAEKDDLVRFCDTHSNSSDEDLSRESQLELCLIPAAEFAASPSDATFEAYTSAIKEYSDCYINYPEHAAKLAHVTSAVFKGSRADSDYARRGFATLSEQMAKTEDEAVGKISEKLARLSIYGQFDLPSLRGRLAWNDPLAEDDLEAAIETLKKNPDSDFTVWIAIIHAYESYLAADEVEKVGAMWQQMRSLSDAITDEEKKVQVKQRLENQKNRVIAIGNPFDFGGTRMPEGDAIVTSGFDYYVIAFCDNSKDSRKLLAQIGSDKRRDPNRYYTILAFNSDLEKDLLDRDAEAAKKLKDKIAIATNETSAKYFTRFQVDLLPYMLLLNEQGEIIAANVQFDQARNLMAKLSSQKNRKAAATP